MDEVSFNLMMDTMEVVRKFCNDTLLYILFCIYFIISDIANCIFRP